ncbi:phage tail protein [Streptomyces sp. NPDC001880]
MIAVAGGPGGREIARLAARVLPDTSTFATSLQRYLDRIEQRARVQVKAVPDLQGFRQELQARLDTVRARVKVQATPDATGFSEDLQARLTRIRAQVRVPVSPDVAGFATRLRAELSAARDGVQIPVTADASRFRASLDTQLGRQPVSVRVRPDVARSELRRIRDQIARRPIRVPVTLVPRAGEMRRLRNQLQSTPLRLATRLEISRREIARVQAELLRHRFTIRLDVDGAASRLQRALSGAGGGGLGGGLALLPGRLAALATAAASAVPSVASLGASLAQMAPAAAVGATGLLSLVTAAAALKIGTAGVGDALKNAFDPQNAEKYNEALAKLTPNARDFVTSLKNMGAQFSAVRKAVQERLFDGLGKQITTAGKVALPVLKKGLADTAGALNAMGSGVLSAAKNLSTSGQLGRAITGANNGLANLSKIPGQFVTGLTQIAVAASPAFDRLTKAAGGAATRIADRISKSLASGSMTKTIDQAVALAGQLFDVLGNVGTILKNVFAPAAAAGGNFLSILQGVTGELAKATASQEVQSALRALFETLALVGKTVAPLVGQALKALGPVIEELAEPAQKLVGVLGGALGRILTALGPVLKAAAGAFGDLVVALLPLIDTFGRLIAAILPALTPLFESLGQIFVEMAPTIKALANNIAAQLVPLLSSLAPILAAILPPFVQLAAQIFPVLTKTLMQLTPGLTDLATSIGELLVELAPVIAAWGQLSVQLATKIMPIVGQVAGLLAGGLSFAMSGLASLLDNVVIPSVRILAAALSGNFSEASRRAIEYSTNAKEKVSAAWNALKTKVAEAAIQLRQAVVTKAGEMRDAFVQKVMDLRAQASQRIAQLPSDFRAALGNVKGILYSAGSNIIQGLIDGIQSKIGAVRSKLSDLTAMLPDWKGPARKDAKILTPAGRLLIEGFIKGIDGTTAKLRSRLESITKSLPSSVSRGIGKSLKKSTTQLSKLVKQRDSVVTQLAKAEKKLTDLTKARDAAAKSVREGILSAADITQTQTGPTTITNITQQLRDALAAAKKFASQLATLKKRGLRADLLQQLGNAGVEQGGAAATALAGASAAQLKEINKLQADLAATASKTGTTVADAMYSAGIQSAKGLVAGLKKEKKSIEQTMVDIAKSMQKAIKKALGIHSPARKLVPVGINAVRGVLLGAEREKPRLDAAMHSLITTPSVTPLPGVTAADAASGALSLDGRRLQLVLDDGQSFAAHVETLADGRVDTALTQVRRTMTNR